MNIVTIALQTNYDER